MRIECYTPSISYFLRRDACAEAEKMISRGHTKNSINNIISSAHDAWKSKLITSINGIPDLLVKDIAFAEITLDERQIWKMGYGVVDFKAKDICFGFEWRFDDNLSLKYVLVKTAPGVFVKSRGKA